MPWLVSPCVRVRCMRRLFFLQTFPVSVRELYVSNQPLLLVAPIKSLNVLNNICRSSSQPAEKRRGEITVVDDKKGDVTVQTEKKLSLPGKYFNEIFKRFPIRHVERFKLVKASSYVYEQLCDEVNTQEFFDEFQLPDTFASWFIVMELHLYVLAARVLKQEKIGLTTRDMLTDNFWNDVQFRSSKLGYRAALYRKKQLMILGLQFQAAFYGYDEGVQSNDMVLAAVVWRRFFGFECDDAQKIERVVKYIRVQLDYLNQLSFEDIVYNHQVLTIPLKNVQIG